MSKITNIAAWVGLAISVLTFGLVANLSMRLSPSVDAGATYNAPPHEEIFPWGFSKGLQIGNPNQAPIVKEMAFGTCTLTAASNSTLPVVATSTSQFNCAVGANVNIQSGDNVQVQLANGHASIYGGFVITDAVASSTASGQNGTITVTVINLTGVATSSFPLATTSATFEVNRI